VTDFLIFFIYLLTYLLNRTVKLIQKWHTLTVLRVNPASSEK